jgi:hypothetical protein
MKQPNMSIVIVGNIPPQTPVIQADTRATQVQLEPSADQKESSGKKEFTAGKWVRSERNGSPMELREIIAVLDRKSERMGTIILRLVSGRPHENQTPRDDAFRRCSTKRRLLPLLTS